MSDVARIRFRNTQRLLEEFVSSRSSVDQVRGIETQFAQQLGITKNYWSALKTGKRQIGAILARQFEARFDKAQGWLDQNSPMPTRTAPQSEEEWFAVGLLLSAYRASPALTKATLLELVQNTLLSSAAETPSPSRLPSVKK